MPTPSIAPFYAGQPIGDPGLLASLEAMRVQTLRNRMTVAPGSGLELRDGPDGSSVRAVQPVALWAKLTGQSGANYAWQEQIRSSGAWVNGSRSGTTSVNKAIEVNGVTTIAVDGSKIVRLFLEEESNEWLFQGDAC